MPPTLDSYLRRLAATAPAAAGEPLDTGIVLLIVVGALLLLAGSGCVFGYLNNWHNKHEINTILFYHAEHHTLRGRDFYWVHMKGGHRTAYIYNHAFMEKHYPYALKVYHGVLRKGPLLDVEIGAEQREVLHTEMIKSNANHGSHSEAMDHETIPKCFLQGLSTQRGDLEPALIFQRRAVLFAQLYQGEAFSHPNEGQDDWKHPPTEPYFDAPLLIAKESSLSYQLGLKKGTNTIAWWVSTVRTHGYDHFERGWNGMVDAPTAAGGNTSKKNRRLSSRQMMAQTYKNSTETTTEMVAMEKSNPVSDGAVRHMHAKAAPPPPLGTSRSYSFTGVNHILIDDDLKGADEHKNDTFSSSSTSSPTSTSISTSSSSSSTTSSTAPPPPPEAFAPPSEDVWYIVDDDPLKPYYQHSVSDKVLWSWQLDTVGDIRVIPFPDKEYAVQENNKTTMLKDAHKYIKSPPPPPPPPGSTRKYSYTGSKHVLFEDKDRNSRSLFQRQKSRTKSAVQRSTNRNSSGQKNTMMQPGKNVWYAIVDDPTKPYYQHSITKEVVWSLAKARSEGEVIVVPFPE